MFTFRCCIFGSPWKQKYHVPVCSLISSLKSRGHWAAPDVCSVDRDRWMVVDDAAAPTVLLLPVFLNRAPESVVQLLGHHTAQSLWESFSQGPGQRAPADCQISEWSEGACVVWVSALLKAATCLFVCGTVGLSSGFCDHMLHSIATRNFEFPGKSMSYCQIVFPTQLRGHIRK